MGGVIFEFADLILLAGCRRMLEKAFKRSKARLGLSVRLDDEVR